MKRFAACLIAGLMLVFLAGCTHAPAWKDIPVMVQVTVEATGTLLLGTEMAAAAERFT